MRAWVVRYITENFDDLLALDLKLARLLGAPSPHTLSSYAELTAEKGRRWGLFCRWFINKLWWWLFNVEGHCRLDLDRVNGVNR